MCIRSYMRLILSSSCIFKPQSLTHVGLALDHQANPEPLPLMFKTYKLWWKSTKIKGEGVKLCHSPWYSVDGTFVLAFNNHLVVLSHLDGLSPCLSFMGNIYPLVMGNHHWTQERLYQCHYCFLSERHREGSLASRDSKVFRSLQPP